MRELVAIVIGVMAACGGGGGKASTTPESSAPADCESAAGVITRVLAAENQAKDTGAVKTEVARRCTEDRWTAEARACLIAANTGNALQDCSYKNLTQEQADKLGKATVALTSMDIERLMGDMVRFKDQLCACKDAPCAQKVSDDLTKWSQEIAAKEKEPPKLTEDQQQRAAAIGEAMGKCMQTAMAASMPPPPPLAVTGLEPDRGDPAGGTYVVIKGTSFTDDGPRSAKVFFGAKQATVIRFAGDGELVVEAPAGKANETVDVKVVFDPGGEMSLPKAFTYSKKKPKPKK